MEKKNKIESKIIDYQKKYNEYEDYLSEEQDIQERINQIEDEILQLDKAQKPYDFYDADVVIPIMEKHIQNLIEEEKKNITGKVNEVMTHLTNINKKVWENYQAAMKLSSEKQRNEIFNSSPDLLESGQFDTEMCEGMLSEAEKATQFHTFFTLNKICSLVFRFDFLGFLPKVGDLPKIVQILIGIIVWGILLLMSPLPFFVTAVLIILVNVVVYIVAGRKADEYLQSNDIVCMAQYNPNKLKEELYNVWLKNYLNGTVAGWRAEVKSIKTNGISDASESDVNSLYCRVKDILQINYVNYQNEIDYRFETLEQVKDEHKEAHQKVEDVEKELKGLEKRVREEAVEDDMNHNQGVLTPAVSIGFSIWNRSTVKKLSVINHNYNPILIYYSDETAKNKIGKFRKNISRLIELLMNGFGDENFDELLDMKLIGLEEIKFPTDKAKGIMEICDSPEELKNLYHELRELKNLFRNKGWKKIAQLNPERLAKRENPIKYQITFFVGVDFSAIKQEDAQLFKVGDEIGFLPIIFMKKSMMDGLLRGDGNDKYFSSVIMEMKENHQIYQFEELVDDFEMDLVISDRRELMEERVYAKRIWSFKELNDALDEGEVSVSGFLYIDAKDLSDKNYQQCEDLKWDDSQNNNFVKYIAFKGEEIPEFVNTDENNKNDRIIWL